MNKVHGAVGIGGHVIFRGWIAEPGSAMPQAGPTLPEAQHFPQWTPNCGQDLKGIGVNSASIPCKIYLKVEDMAAAIENCMEVPEKIKHRITI